MPKTTFYNLTKEKREKIIECAKGEFSTYGYYDSSINRMIKKADISRGSFYQYFEDKEDLYMYLLNCFTKVMLTGIRKKIEEKNYDLFEFQLLIFDYITLEAMESKDKEFIISAVSNMDLKLGNRLMKANQTAEGAFHFMSMDSMKITNEKQAMDLINILIMSLTSELVSYFNQIKDLESCRESLKNTATMIKYGVMK